MAKAYWAIATLEKDFDLVDDGAKQSLVELLSKVVYILCFLSDVDVGDKLTLSNLPSKVGGSVFGSVALTSATSGTPQNSVASRYTTYL